MQTDSPEEMKNDGDADGIQNKLWIHPIFHQQVHSDEQEPIDLSNPSRKNGSYRIIQQLVTASPNPRSPDAEIETALEAFVTPGGECLWRRVAVWSGPTSQRVTHASFLLPITNPNGSSDIETYALDGKSLLEQPSLVCWAAFPERPDHKLLCVLVSPSTLSIWDVYPDSDKVYVSGEGHSVSLPFQCCAIHPLGDSNGVLLERKEDQEDVEARQASQNMDISQPELDDDFFLKVPPRNTRMGSQATTEPTAHGNAHFAPLATPRSVFNSAPSEVSSLFSLKHPLEDVLPVSLLSQIDNSETLVTDVFEKIVHTATMRWTDPSDDYLSKREYQQPICVTYNTVSKRHAIWAIKGAPPPTAEPPLWQRTRKLRSTKDWDNHIGFLDQDLEDMELLGIMDPALHAGPTRDEALADALGVRRTPRKSLEPRPRNQRPENVPTPVNRSGIAHRSMRDGSFLDADVTLLENTTNQQPQQLLNMRPLSNLHPDVTLECLYEERQESEPASNVFLASNLEGSGNLVVGLVCPPKSQQSANPNSLRLLLLQPTKRDRLPERKSQGKQGAPSETMLHYFAANLLCTMECLTAQPIQAIPTPPCCIPPARKKEGNNCHLTTEILVLQEKAARNGCLSLYRAQAHIVDCALISDENDTAIITDIRNAVGGMVSFDRQNDEGSRDLVRGSVALEIASSGMAEKVLEAIESSIVSKGSEEQMEFAVKLRADCCRLEQGLRGDNSSSLPFDDPGWLAVTSMIETIVDFELFGSSPKARHSVGPEKSSATMDQSSWESLLGSSFHADFSSDHEDSCFLGKPANALMYGTMHKGKADVKLCEHLLSSTDLAALHCLESGKTVFSFLFETLHLVYEDFKLSSDSSRADHLRAVGSFLVKICCKCLQAENSDIHSLFTSFLDHYRSDLGSSLVEKLQSKLGTKHATTTTMIPDLELTSFESPPSILQWLCACITGKTYKNVYDMEDLSTLNAACARTRLLLRIFRVLFQQDENKLDRDHEVISILCQEGFPTVDEVRDELSSGVALPILEALNRCRDNPCNSSGARWSAAEFNLVGRQDLARNESKNLLDAPLNEGGTKIQVRVNTPSKQSFVDKDKDGLVPLQLTSAMLFPGDNRIKEAGRLLRSSTPCFLSVPRAIEVSDHEYERLKQNKLLLLCRRKLALSVGRGMLTIGSFQPVAAEPLPVPVLCLAGRVPPANANLALDMSECQSGFGTWPEFHNGCCAGLRLPMGSEASESVSMITRTWIVYNRPNPNSDAQPQNQTNGRPRVQQDQSHAHGGLLLALGIRGHLAALEMTDLYEYLTQGQCTTTVGVLLGMACNKRGSCDISVSKMLCLHLPSLIPQHFSAIDVASPVQTAAVTGAGLLFQGSSHRLISEFLISEIGRRPESDVTLDREAYTLSCGIALGMVNICKGNRITGGQQSGEGEGLHDLQIGERLYRYIVGGKDEEEMHRTREANDRQMPTTSSMGENEKCSCVFEGDSINIAVTAAGATLALGFIFLKSGNQNIASAIALPDTHFLLEYVRPDFLALRVISKGLILWDTVEPSREWIESQLPLVVREAYKQMQAKMKRATDLGDMLDSDEEGDSFQEVEDPAGARRGVHFSDSSRARGRAPQTDYDVIAVRQIYAHVIAGACFALGLRFAGTANKLAASAIFERVVELQTLRDANDSVSAAMRPEPQILETALGCCAIALAMVQAGTGDLETLKLFKILRWRCDEEVKYGTHMSFAMAIGLLFLGGGTCTLGREPEDIAALVAAFFPRFPYTTSDNQYHLQALRHLYALAVKRKDIRFVDVDSGEIVPITIEIKYRDPMREPLRLTAPCLLPNADEDAEEARIVSNRFYPLQLQLDKNSYGKTFFVKRRNEGPCSSICNPQRPILTQAATFQEKSLRGNGYVHAFEKYLCFWSAGKSHHTMVVEDFCKSILQEGLRGGTDLALPIYLRLRATIPLIEAESSSSALFAWDFRLIRAYYEMRSQNREENDQRLLNVEKLAYLTEFVERVAEEMEKTRGTSIASNTCLSILQN